MPTAFVQLARHGDLVSALPFMRARSIEEGEPVACYVAPAFASILEPCSYVKPILRRTHHRDIEETVNQAKRDGYDPIIATQVHANPSAAPAGAKNFVQEQWMRAGYWDRFHGLPLIFDQRDKEAEQAILEKHLPRPNGKPILAYSLSGHSSPFPQRKEFHIWLKGAFGYEFQLLDLSSDEFGGEAGQIRLEKPHHLLPLIEAATVCLFTDSLPLHLTYDSCKPVFALHRDQPAERGKPTQWWWSEPRRHWIGQATYGEVMMPGGRHRLVDAICNPDRWPSVRPPMSVQDRTRRIMHVADWYMPATEAEAIRNQRAQRSWQRIEISDIGWHSLYFKSGRRTSQGLGDARKLPYLRDVLDWAVERAGDQGIVCFTNTDSCLTTDTPSAIRSAIARSDCAYSHRINIDEPPERITQAELRNCTVDGGTDLFAFKASWWRRNREAVPDFILGCDAWDCCLRRIMAMQGGVKINPPIVLHARHAPFWKRSENIEANPGQKHNRSLYRAWCAAWGFEVKLDRPLAMAV